MYGDVRIEEEDPTSGRMRKLQLALKRITRFLTGISLQDRIKTEELLQRAKLPQVNQMAAEQKLGETFRAGKTEIPGVTNNIILVSSKEHTMTTRGQIEGNIMLMTGEAYRRDSFLYKAVRLWNALPNWRVIIKSLNPCFVKKLPMLWCTIKMGKEKYHYKLSGLSKKKHKRVLRKYIESSGWVKFSKIS